MKRMGMKKTCIFIVLWLMVFNVMSIAQVRLTGEITGIVTDEKGAALPGASVTLTGEKLFQKSMTAVTGQNGTFRFLNLNPGNYEILLTLPGFNTLKISPIGVSVGKSMPLIAKLAEAKVNEEVVVKAVAPLIDTKDVQVSTNFSNEIIQNLPTSRNFQDLVESTPAINDYGAYGSGGKVSKSYYKGSSSNSYLLNGVDISDPSTGTTWVNPNYDTIEEIQVVGAGATAEYGNYTGAVLNVITKTGGNKFHGGISSFYTSSKLTGDNSSGIVDLKPDDQKYYTDNSAYFSGPIIKEKLFFFLAGGFTGYQNKIYASPDYAKYKAPHIQANLNWVVNSKNTVTLMFNTDPIDHSNQGLLANSSTDIAYSRVFRSTVWNADWRSMLSADSIFEVRYAGFNGHDRTDPAVRDVASVVDYSTGMTYGSSGMGDDNKRTRNDANATFTRYLDNFLGMSHELKIGVEYEKSETKDYFYSTGADNSFFEVYPVSGYYYVIGYADYTGNTDAKVDRFSGFIQDNLRVNKRLTLNIGARFDSPRLKSPGVSGSIMSYTDIAPRFGLSYDLTGDAKNVIHIGFGRYYEKMTTELHRALPGLGDITYYMALWDHAPDLSAEGLAALPSLIITEENYAGDLPMSTVLSADPNVHSPYSDMLNIRFDRELLKDLSFSLEFIHRWDRDLLNYLINAEHTYAPNIYTEPTTGKTIMVWTRTDSNEDTYTLSNSSWAKRNHDFVIMTLDKRDNGTWSMMASATYQNSRGNVDNQYWAGGRLDGASGDPNYAGNQLLWGKLSFNRTWQFKLMGTYHAPLGINLSGNLHILSGLAWTTQINSSLTGYDLIFSTLILEQRGCHEMPWSWSLDLRVSKDFRLGASKIELMADLLNVFNRDNATSVGVSPYSVYPISGGSAYGKVFSLETPFQARFGVRWAF